ncbi:hypothetical protein LIER_15600 [Lithospermum erythrorhizon]|uniref:Uncharacterized protein n=1 Tax=Lithospermum erythrorhizon TaxID=34254 RepID=A0AAV3Q3H9_LITER
MDPNGSNDHRPPGNDELNLNNPVDRKQEDAPADAQGPANLRSGGTMPEVGNSHPPEMAGLIQGLTGTLVTSVMQMLREQLPQLRKENPVKVSFVREDGEETYTHTPPVRMGNELMAGQKSRHDALAHEAVTPAPPADVVAAIQWKVDALSIKVAGLVQRGTNTEQAGLAPFSLEIRSAVMPAGVKLPTSTKFTERPTRRNMSPSFSHKCLSTSPIAGCTTRLSYPV